MKTLIIKLGASGDVVRTTTLCHILQGEIYWLTNDANIELVAGVRRIKNCINWSSRRGLEGETFDCVINLEDSIEASRLLQQINYDALYGAYIDASGKMEYTENARGWFDLSLISRFGRTAADKLKLQNRKTYQELIYAGLGHSFQSEPYLLPESGESRIAGDIAIADKCGSIWPMKNWAFYDELKSMLENRGFKVNYLPTRNSMLEHISDIKAHRYLISGDSLPMHIALGCGIRCLSIFICTSPWEICDYGLQKKIVAPELERYFYKKKVLAGAAKSVSLENVYNAVLEHLR